MTPQVVLLMAGLGSRFSRMGWRQSKPLIEVRGKPMFARALEGLAPLAPLDLHVVVRQDQVDDEQILEIVEEHHPGAEAVIVPEVTPGAAYSALAAVDHLDARRPVIVLDCDLRFRSDAYLHLIRDAAARRLDGVLLVFRSGDERYSYAKRNAEGLVARVAEKQAISTDAIAGAYYFATAHGLAKTLHAAVAKARSSSAEVYMSDVVGELLDERGRIALADVDEYESYGTPEELNQSLIAGTTT